jgi:hypothetical protein
VSVVVDGGSAGVHADLGVAKRTKFLDLRRHCIKKTERHDFRSSKELKILGG